MGGLIPRMRRLEVRQTRFQRIEVWGTPDETEFRVTGAVHAWWHRHRFLTGLAWDCIAAGILSHPGQPVSILMLGLGGGTSLRTLQHLLPQASSTAIEIDPDMIGLARGYMELDRIGTRIITDDAYQWLASCRGKFDVIFDDVYGVTADDVARPGPITPEIAAAIHRCLKPDGIFAANLVTGKGHRRTQSAMRSFFRSSFPSVRSVTTPDSLNECLVGGSRLAPWHAIRARAADFPDNADYGFWRLLRARTIGRPGQF